MPCRTITITGAYPSPEDITTALESLFTSTEDASSQPEAPHDDDSELVAAVPGMRRDASEHLFCWRMIGWLQRRGSNRGIPSQVLKVSEAEEKNKQPVD